MKDVYRLLNPLKSYPWGSYSALPELLGRKAPSLQPQAELWMGAHPRGRSVAVTEMGEVPLDRLLKQQSSALLGRRAARLFAKRLPFLFKILAVEQPLSIQLHPDRARARAGYRAEKERQVARDAAERRYPDPWPKPELVYAVTHFEALHGLRPRLEARQGLERLQVDELRETVAALDSVGTGETFLRLLRLQEPERSALAEAVSTAAARLEADPDWGSAARWCRRIAELHPHDPALIAPFLMHIVELAPGEALFTGPGTLHAYLAGTALEVMGSSDNVLRAGLTSKHVDVDELARLLARDEEAPELAVAEELDEGVTRFDAGAREFELLRLRLEEDRPYRAPDDRSLEIVLCLTGEVTFDNQQRELQLRGGQALAIGAAAPAYRLSGNGEVFVATIPAGESDDEEWGLDEESREGGEGGAEEAPDEASSGPEATTFAAD